jgi:hypothetical protein
MTHKANARSVGWASMQHELADRCAGLMRCHFARPVARTSTKAQLEEERAQLAMVSAGMGAFVDQLTCTVRL